MSEHNKDEHKDKDAVSGTTGGASEVPASEASTATDTPSAVPDASQVGSTAPSDVAGSALPSGAVASGAESPAASDAASEPPASPSQGGSSVPASSAKSSKSQHSRTDAGATSKTEGGALESRKSSPAGGFSTSKASQRPKSSGKRMKLGDLDLSKAKVGFIGAGKMAESTINGLIHYGKIQPSRIYVAAPSTKGLERFKTLGCRVTKRNYDIFGRYDCDIVFLCFHGYVIKHCYKLGGNNRPHPLTTNYIPHQRHPVYILSLVSGVSMSQIKACLLNPDSTSRYVIELHRIMLNTAVGHGLGICAIDCEPDSKKLSAPIRQLLSSIAHLEFVPASQMDAACAIGGSGLAFSYYFINALADGAFRMGLSRQQAIKFASKTAQCAAQTMLESGKHPAELRDNVSAPSGAAIYGIHVLEKNDVASGVTAAVEAAHKRAYDLANQDVNA